MRERIGTFTTSPERKQVEAALRTTRNCCRFSSNTHPRRWRCLIANALHPRSRRWRTNIMFQAIAADRRVARRRHPVIPEIWKMRIGADCAARSCRGMAAWNVPTAPSVGCAGKYGPGGNRAVKSADRNFLRRYHRFERAEAALSDSEARLRTALEAASMGTSNAICER